MTVVHVLASTRADHGGTSRSVPTVCEALDTHGVEVHLVTAAPPGDGETEPLLPNGAVHSHLIEESGPLSARLRSPGAFAHKLNEVVCRVNPDIIHDHGAWLPSNALSAWSAWRHEVPLIVSLRGMFTDWALAHRVWKKRLAWYSYQKWILRQATCFHVTAEAEVRDIRELGLSQPAAVIPNGVVLPDTLPSPSFTGPKRVLFLSRIHPKKGLPMLLEAWAELRPEGWTLELVGPSENDHRAELEAQAEALGLDGEVVFSGAVEDADKWHKYAAADLFVLPTHSENFGIVVAEALAAGVPALTTTGAPWAVLEEEDCGWWAEPSVDAITAALRDATQRSDAERRAMGRRGRRLVESTYTWQAVGQQMKQAYEWLLRDGASRPSFIQE